MMRRRFDNIITYLSHPIANASSESINAKRQWLKYTAPGFRNKQNLIDAIISTAEVWVWLRAATKNSHVTDR